MEKNAFDTLEKVRNSEFSEKRALNIAVALNIASAWMGHFSLSDISDSNSKHRTRIP